jgi:hypothetical protein
LSCWELLNPTIYLSSDRQKVLAEEKKERAKSGAKAKLLDKIVGLIDRLKEEKEIPKLEAEHAKYLSLV